LCAGLLGTEHVSLAAGRPGETFHVQTKFCKCASDVSLDCVRYEYSAGAHGVDDLSQRLFAPAFGVNIWAECIMIHNIEVLRGKFGVFETAPVAMRVGMRRDGPRILPRIECSKTLLPYRVVDGRVLGVIQCIQRLVF